VSQDSVPCLPAGIAKTIQLLGFWIF